MQHCLSGAVIEVNILLRVPNGKQRFGIKKSMDFKLDILQ